jgi:hypothetical protein
MKKALHVFKLDSDFTVSMTREDVYEEAGSFVYVCSSYPVIQVEEADKPLVSEDLRDVYFFTLNQQIDTDVVRKDMLKCLKKHVKRKNKELQEVILTLTTQERKINKELKNN